MSLDALELAAPAAPVTVLLEPAERPTFDDERTALLRTLLPPEIASPHEYAGIAEDRARLKAYIDRVEPEYDAVCRSAKKAHDDACRLRERFIGPLRALYEASGTLLSRYNTRQKEIQRAEERRLAEEERQREMQRRDEEARLLKKQGQLEMAAAVKATPVYAPAVSLPSAIPKVEGLGFRDHWKWRPIGGDTPQNRVRAIAMLVPKDFREFVKLDDAGLNRFAARTKGTVRVPGVEFYNEPIPVQK